MEARTPLITLFSSLSSSSSTSGAVHLKPKHRKHNLESENEEKSEGKMKGIGWDILREVFGVQRSGIIARS